MWATAWRESMSGKIFRSTVFVAIIVLVASIGIIMGVLYDYFDGVQVEQLQAELNLAATGTEQNGLDYLRKTNSDWFRLTWISPDGTVLYDTWADETSMENHLNRAEIQMALMDSKGTSTRYSSTLTEKTTYAATLLSDGSLLRISASSATTTSLVVGMLQPFTIVLVIAIVLSAFLSHRMAKRIVGPINQLDLERPLENDCYEELTPLLRRINQQHSQIHSQMQALRRQADEFREITRNMNEGLVLLDKNGHLLSINPAAGAFFGVEDPACGALPAHTSPEVHAAIRKALECGHSDLRMAHGDREYQLELSRITSDGTVIGAVLLTFDVTEQQSAEQTRREFSANVSHELKTPLQSIIGSAELLENGLVAPEDTQRFVGHIRKEASRLVTLVEDIIRLSQLDEGVELPTEEVELQSLVKEILPVLQPAADSRNITFRVTGPELRLTGVRRLLYEIVYNLCDNAVKYNVDGGSVEIRLSRREGHSCLTVADTGIGIPAEQQARVFERFYRVDKSHSKQSGGTGLGLSIVKHAAQYHHARIQMESVPGKGTEITVLFP